MIAELRLDTSKLWWGFLGVRSHASLTQGAERAVFFDALHRFPQDLANTPGVRFFFVFWDGVHDEHELAAAQAALGPAADLRALFVGNNDLSEATAFRPGPLYPPGALHFTLPSSAFDPATRKAIRKLRTRQRLMPAKNLLQRNVDRAAGLDLLLGRKRLVFCGVYLFSAALLEQFCGYHAVDPTLVHGRALFEEDPDRSWQNYLRYLERDGQFYAAALDRGATPFSFFRRIVRVLLRGYYVLRLQHEGCRMFLNGWTSGSNINVYTTPWYKQHRFLDFGSVAGAGNYPRLADLSFFGKETVCAENVDEDLEIVQAAREGRLEQLFSQAYERQRAALWVAP